MLRNLFKSGVIYALGSAANSAALLLLIPFLVSALSPAEYGAWALYEIFVLMLSLLITSGLDIGLMREYWAQEDEAARRRLAGTVVGVVGVWSLALLALLWLGAALARPLACPAGDCVLLRPELLNLALLCGPVEALFALLVTVLRIRERAAAFAILSFGRLGLFLACAISGVSLGYGLAGALGGRLVGGALALVVAAWTVRGYLAPALDRAVVRRVLRYGLPLLPTSLAAYVLVASDRYVLQGFASLEAVAVYTFAYKLASGLEVLVTRPFGLDWAPRRFALAARPNPGPQFAEALVVYLFAASSGGLLIAAAAPLAYTWLAPPAYAAGLPLLPVILVALALYGMSYPLNIGIMLKDRTRLLPGLSWLAAGVCLGLNLWWIGAFGMVGAAWATLVSYAVYTGAIAATSLRLYPVRYSAARLGVVAVAALLGAAGLAVVQGLAARPSILSALAGMAWVAATAAAAAYALWQRGRRTGGFALRPEDASATGSN